MENHSGIDNSFAKGKNPLYLVPQKIL